MKGINGSEKLELVRGTGFSPYLTVLETTGLYRGCRKTPTLRLCNRARL
jgi:hypothetical protein